MMRIGVDASQANAAQRTGTEWYAFDVLHALARVRGEEEYTLYLETPLRDDLADLGPGFTSKVLSWPLKRFWHQGRLSGEMLRNAPDVFFAPAHALPLLQAQRSVTTIHDVGFEDFPGLYPRAERIYHRFALRHALRTAERIIVPSIFTLERIRAHFSIDEKRFTVIHHGFHAERYGQPPTPEEQQRVKERYRLVRPFFFFMGRIEQKKNVANLVSAYAQMRKNGIQEIDLVLAGNRGYGAEAVDAIRTAEGLESTVHLLGYVDVPDAKILMSMARGFIFVSNYEGFGFPVLEAFAAKTPALISRAGSLPEIAEDAALNADPGNIAEISAQLAVLATDNAVQQALVEKGTRRLAAFSWDDAARKTRKVLLGD